MLDPTQYNITVRKGKFDGETFYEAKIKELPDISEYADTFVEAYSLALDTIETTADIFASEGRKMPLPMVENSNFSGRVTLRMAKSLHASCASLADTEGVSLNQLIVNTLTYRIGHEQN